MSFIINIKKYYESEGFEIYPYSQEEVNEACNRLGGLPELFKEYLLTVGRVEEEVQMPMRLLPLDKMYVEEGVLIIADFTNAFGIKFSDFDLGNDTPIYCRGEFYYEIIDDYDDEWVEWKVEDDGDELKGLADFFIVSLKDNTDLGIEAYRANREFWTKLGYTK